MATFATLTHLTLVKSPQNDTHLPPKLLKEGLLYVIKPPLFSVEKLLPASNI